MKGLAAQLMQTVAERELLPAGASFLLAVSGGVDSMTLLHLLHAEADTQKWKITLAHFNHQLRGIASHEDALLVRETARKTGLPLICGSSNVRQFCRRAGLSLEMGARQLRHDFLAEAAVNKNLPTIVLAHHADDQTELFFLRLLRGAGQDGLSGMDWTGPSPSRPKVRLVRPLLEVSKAQLEEYARAHQVAYREDASNAVLDRPRNRVRYELIPLLKKNYQPALQETVKRLLELNRAEAVFLAEAARAWQSAKERLLYDQLPIALQRQLIHEQWPALGINGNFDLTETLRLHPGRKISLDATRLIWRDDAGRLQTSSPQKLSFNREEEKVQLTGSGAALSFAGLKIAWKMVDVWEMGRPGVEYYDADKVGPEIWLRCWQPGDRFQPIGTRSARKLQDLFTNLKIPAAARRERVVAGTGSGELFWVEGLRMAEKFKLDASTRRGLKWSWKR